LLTVGWFSGVPDATEAQLVWKASKWKLAELEKLVQDPARIKQLYDVVQIGDGKFLSNIKNSFDGLQFGFGIPERQIKIAAALHGPANMLNYDDYIWEKYQIGEWLKVTDPATGKPAMKNLFYKSKSGLMPESAAKNPDDLDSIYQDTGMQSPAIEGRAVSELPYRARGAGPGPYLSQQAVPVAGRCRERHAGAFRSGSLGRSLYGRGYCTSPSRRPLHIYHGLDQSVLGHDDRRCRHIVTAMTRAGVGCWFFNTCCWQHDCIQMVERSHRSGLEILRAARETGGNGDGRGLHVSLWSDVVQVRATRGGQRAPKGCDFHGSGYEGTGVGDVGERCASLEGLEKRGCASSRSILEETYVDEIMRYL